MSNPLTPQADCIIEEQMKNYLYTDGSKVEGPCGLSTGAGKLTFLDLGGVTISNYLGTSTPSISNNDINITTGTLYDLKLSDGTWIPNPADGYDISKNENHATPSNLTESTQNDLNTLQDLGFTAVIVNEFDPVDRIPYDVYRKPIYEPLGSEFSVVEYPPGLYTLNDGGKIDFNSIRDKHMLDSEENPDVGIESPGSWTLGSGVSISNNKIVVDGTQGAPTYAYILANTTLYNVNFRKFEAVYRCVSRTAGQHKVVLGGYDGSDYSITVGPMRIELVVSNPSSNNRLYYYFDKDFIGEVELLSVREIIKEPVKYHLDDEVLLNSDFEDGFTNGLANNWSKYESDNIAEEENNIIHGKHSAQKIVATAEIQNLGIEQSIDVDDCYINHFVWVFCSRNFGINGIRLQLTDNYDKYFTIPARVWIKIYCNSYPGAIGSKIFRIYVDPANVKEDDYIIVDDCSFRQTILNPYFLHMFNKNAVVGNEDNFPEVYSTGIRSGNNNYDMLNPYKWVFEELNPTYLSTYLQTAFINKLFMKLIKNDDGDIIALKNILSYKDKLTGIDLKRVERYFGGE